jgi:SAM-dependent methyltransferase
MRGGALGILGRTALRLLPPAVRRRVTGGSSRASGWPSVGAVDLGDLRRTTPISRDWGFDRGTPVDRYFIERFLAANAMSVRGRVLEIDTDEYTRAFGGGRVTRSDALHQSEYLPGITIVDDLTDGSTLDSDAFDCVLVTQTLQLIYDPAAALRTIHRILKPGGVALCTVPGISKITGDEAGRWGYFWGFTGRSARTLFGERFDTGHVEVQEYGNVLTASAFLFGLAAEELRPADLEHRDPGFPVLLGVRATKGRGPARCRGAG